MTKDYSYKNASNVLKVVDRYLADIDAGKCSSYKIDDVYRELSIFDCWVKNIGKSRLKEMHDFLTKAIDLGFTGCVNFKVGASGCANGMWAFREPTTDGWSPRGDYLYRSFTPDYTSWEVCIDGVGLVGQNQKYKNYNDRTFNDVLYELAKLACSH